MTQHYTGTKIVVAWPQKQVQGQDVREGYAVKYADGYTSWSPKDVFEAAYLPLGHIDHLPPHVQRMHGEYAELDDRFTKLCAFMETETFASLSDEDRHLMQAQATAMRAYLNALSIRIDRCEPDEGAAAATEHAQV